MVCGEVNIGEKILEYVHRVHKAHTALPHVPRTWESGVESEIVLFWVILSPRRVLYLLTV